MINKNHQVELKTTFKGHLTASQMEEYGSYLACVNQLAIQNQNFVQAFCRTVCFQLKKLIKEKDPQTRIKLIRTYIHSKKKPSGSQNRNSKNIGWR